MFRLRNVFLLFFIVFSLSFQVNAEKEIDECQKFSSEGYSEESNRYFAQLSFHFSNLSTDKNGRAAFEKAGMCANQQVYLQERGKVQQTMIHSIMLHFHFKK